MELVSPVILLTNVPIPVPFVVWLPVTMGFGDVLQQTPRAVTVAPPSLLIFPPLAAVIFVIEVTPNVVRLAKDVVGVLPFSELISF